MGVTNVDAASMDAFNAGLDLFATVVSVALALCTVAVRAHRDSTPPRWAAATSRPFLGLCLASAAMAFTDLLSWALPLPLGPIQMNVIFVGNFIFNFSGAVLFECYALFLRKVLASRSHEVGVKARYPLWRLATAVLLVYALMCVMSLETHGVYTVNATTRYYRGELFLLAQALLVFLYVCVFITVAANARMLELREMVSLSSYVLLPAGAELIQVTRFGAALMPLSITFSLVVIFLGVQEGREAATRREEVRLAKAHLAIAEARIDPESLYEALDEASGLCQTDPEAAAERIGALARDMRTRMRSLGEAGRGLQGRSNGTN